MAKRLGISTATLSKNSRIIKLPDDLIQSIARLLDQKRITFEAAYVISNMRNMNIKWLIEGVERYPDRELDLKKLKDLPSRNAKDVDNAIQPISKKQVLETLVSPSLSGTIDPTRKTAH